MFIFKGMVISPQGWTVEEDLLLRNSVVLNRHFSFYDNYKPVRVTTTNDPMEVALCHELGCKLLHSQG